jgi:UDP-N-acetylglucosamine/UDP-N-acetylgalactosamine 4-epimerase
MNKLTQQYRWLVTGCAGFIGSNLVESLLENNQMVIGIDNLSTGFKTNLDDALSKLSDVRKRNFKFINGDILDRELCIKSAVNIDFVLHQAALGSVPRSIENPVATHEANVNGFLNILEASRLQGIKRLVYASSSSVYGDIEDSPKKEELIGKPLSPYAVSKLTNELYAHVYAETYGLQTVGLRYFNVFGKRQNPAGAYAAVIPKWIYGMIEDNDIIVNGDGHTSRDFCVIDNVIKANVATALRTDYDMENKVFNVACSQSTSLNDLYDLIKVSLTKNQIKTRSARIYEGFRKGDVRHSLASIDKLRSSIPYEQPMSLVEGLDKYLPWYVDNWRQKNEK